MGFAGGAGVFQGRLARFQDCQETRPDRPGHVDDNGAVENLVADRVGRLIDIDGARNVEIRRQRQSRRDRACRWSLQAARRANAAAASSLSRCRTGHRRSSIRPAPDSSRRARRKPAIAVRRCKQHRLQERRDHIAVRQHVVIARQARRIGPFRPHRADKQERVLRIVRCQPVNRARVFQGELRLAGAGKARTG